MSTYFAVLLVVLLLWTDLVKQSYGCVWTQRGNKWIAYELLCEQKDCNNPFQSYKVAELNAVSLEALYEDVVKDDTKVYKNCRRILRAHAPSFSVLPNGYMRDKFHVFFNDNILELQPEEIDLLKFSIIKDQQNVYLFDKKLEDANGSSFQVVLWPIGKDTNHVYDLRMWKKVEDANATSFVHIYGLFFKDDKHAFLEGNKMQDSHAPTFMPLQHYYSMDAFHVFFYERQIPNADPSSFLVLSKMWSKDASRVYLNGNEFEQADASTFTVLLFGYAKDKNHAFYYNSIIQGVNAAAFDVIPCKMMYGTSVEEEEGCATDDQNYFFQGELA